MTLAGQDEYGIPKVCQDNCSVTPLPFGQELGIMCIVSDGHGQEGPNGESGEKASDLLVKELPHQFLVALKEVEADAQGENKNVTTKPDALKKAVSKAISKVQQMMKEEKFERAGATLVGYVLFKDLLVCFNTGDSTLVLKRKDSDEPDVLSRVHNCKDPEEAARVREKGGHPSDDGYIVESSGNYIGMSRSHGDVYWHEYGLSAEPHIAHAYVKSGDRLYTYTDGVGDFLTPKSVVNMLDKCETLPDGCKRIISAAAKCWKKDSQEQDPPDEYRDDCLFQVLIVRRSNYRSALSESKYT